MAARENNEKENSNKRKVMEEFTISGSSKRIKISDESSSSPGSAESVTKSATPASHNLEAIDLKLEKSETEVCMISNGEFSGEAIHQSKEELSGGGDLGEEMESSSSPPLSTPETETTPSLPKSGGESGDDQTPSAAEIEDFFSAAEKYQQKRFAEKYNYDVVKDVPLEGKYKWIPLKL